MNIEALVKEKEVVIRGKLASYSCMTGVYKDKVTFSVKLPNENSHNEFSVPEDMFSPLDTDKWIYIYAHSYEQGRCRGMWEKAGRLRELFNQLRMEAL